jgi:type VI protein secretion system component Hcp
MTRDDTVGASKKRKAAKQLRQGKKMEEQKPLSVTKVVDMSSPILFNMVHK